MRIISWVAEHLLASHEGLCSMESVRLSVICHKSLPLVHILNLIVRILKDTFQYYHPMFPRVFQKAYLLLLEVVCAEPDSKALFSPIYATCSAHNVILNFVISEYRSWSSSQSSFRLSPTPSLQLVATEVLFRRHLCCRLQISSALKITAAGLSRTVLISSSVECIASNIWAGMVQQHT